MTRRVRRAAVIVIFFGLAGSMLGGTSAFLPLGKSMANGNDLPIPMGVGMTVHYQQQDLQLSHLDVDLAAPIPGIDLNALIQAAELGVDNELVEVNLEVDVWVLPFLNVFALLGYIDGETAIDVRVPPQDLGFSIDYEGLVYGAGTTLAGGWDSFFASVTATLTETDLDVSSSSVRAWVLTPKLGVNTRLGSFWLGGMYQEAQELHKGDIAVDMFGMQLPLSYDVELEQDEPWNYLAGFSTTLFDCWQLTLEGGVGGRTQATVKSAIRF